jgi:hypothetical protein
MSESDDEFHDCETDDGETESTGISVKKVGRGKSTRSWAVYVNLALECWVKNKLGQSIYELVYRYVIHTGSNDFFEYFQDISIEDSLHKCDILI